MSFRRILIALVALAQTPCFNGEFSIDDAALFRVNFAKRHASQDLFPEAAEASGHKIDDFSEDLDRVIMTTTNHEKYSCTIPKVSSAKTTEEESYVGPNALEILRKLFDTQACAYRLEHYWTYELCHGRYIRQFHEERDGDKVKVNQTEYVNSIFCYQVASFSS